MLQSREKERGKRRGPACEHDRWIAMRCAIPKMLQNRSVRLAWSQYRICFERQALYLLRSLFLSPLSCSLLLSFSLFFPLFQLILEFVIYKFISNFTETSQLSGPLVRIHHLFIDTLLQPQLKKIFIIKELPLMNWILGLHTLHKNLNWARLETWILKFFNKHLIVVKNNQPDYESLNWTNRFCESSILTIDWSVCFFQRFGTFPPTPLTHTAV